LKNFSHQEYNKPNYINKDNIYKLISQNKDILMRNNPYGGFKFIPIENNKDLPKYYSLSMFPELKYLTHLGFKHNSDKSWFHFFTEFYNDYFDPLKNKSINILEIGIYQGSSLKMMKEYFPYATIYAIDINPEYVNKNYGNRIKPYLCSQDNFSLFDTIFKDIKFDIIIDDGSHQTLHQKKSLGHMFSYLNSGGIYVCEDLHTSYSKMYCNTKISTLKMLEDYNRINKIESNIIPSNKLEYLNTHIEKVDIFYKNKNALKCYKCGKINFDNFDLCECSSILCCNKNPSITSVIIHK
jgi:hypothetical protein